MDAHTRRGMLVALVLALGQLLPGIASGAEATAPVVQKKTEATQKTEAPDKPFVDRDGDGIQDGQEHRFRRRRGAGGRGQQDGAGMQHRYRGGEGAGQGHGKGKGGP